ncbi:hypothetical protein [Stenotrophomonas oahuensis]|uniref:Damage-inducible protein J n=1 Tax=Stenotrophomonas oahuensis TaxID=3003271 RepID=A0ABY9YUN3_9GAMM|nr:hypothetical protein [Stenotrophomonas sp. A5586]WNH54255.1 hypothetical protein PDM29_08260 [Stenotrophomonas sp. A5586]
MSSQTLLMKFKDKDTPNTVTRSSVKAMAEILGFNETQLINYALAKLREQVMPSMPAPTPDLSPAALQAIRERFEAHEVGYKPTRSLIDGL